MAMIVSRYLTKEVLNALLGVTFVLLLIFLSNQLVRYFASAASGKLASHVLIQLMGFEIPYLLALLLPLGLYLGILLAYGRLYADSEMYVLQASGLGIQRLVWITAGLMTCISIIVMLLTLWINPLIVAKKEKVIAEGMTATHVLDNLIPGRFQVSNGGQRVVYVESISKRHNTKQANNIFIAEQGKAQWIVVSADQGYQTSNPKTHDYFLIAEKGYRYEGMPGQNNYKIIQFKKYAVRTPDEALYTQRQEQQAISTIMLMRNYQKPENAAELQWRFSMIISVWVLALLAVPLSKIKLRRGRYSQIFVGILLYIIYVNLLFVSREWLEQQMIPASLGMWWAHGLFFVLALVLILAQSGWRPKRS